MIPSEEARRRANELGYQLDIAPGGVVRLVRNGVTQHEYESLARMLSVVPAARVAPTGPPPEKHFTHEGSPKS